MSQNPGGGTTVTYLGKVSTPEPRILTMGTQSAINPSSVKVRVAKTLQLHARITIHMICLLQVTNTGDTGMIPNAAIIEGNVPADVPSMSFNIGNSLAVSNSKSHNNPKVVTAGNSGGGGGLVASIRVVGGDEDMMTSDGGDPTSSARSRSPRVPPSARARTALSS